MNYLDIIIIIILIISFFSGLRTGLVKGVFALIGIVLGLVLAGNYHSAFSDSTIGRVTTFIIIFLVVAGITSLIGSLVKKLVHAVMLGWLDHLGGAVLGVVTSGLFLAVALVAYLYFFGPNSIITSSVVTKILVDKLSWFLALLPSTFTQPVKSFFY